MDHIEYSLFEREVEQLFPTLDELGIGFVAYSPLGRGLITGTAKPAGQYEATDMRNVDPRWQPGNFEKNVEAVDRLAELAAALTDADIKAIDEILPLGGFGARYTEGHVPTWI